MKKVRSLVRFAERRPAQKRLYRLQALPIVAKSQSRLRW